MAEIQKMTKGLFEYPCFFVVSAKMINFVEKTDRFIENNGQRKAKK
jgi:hypothetical protein